MPTRRGAQEAAGAGSGADPERSFCLQAGESGSRPNTVRGWHSRSPFLSSGLLGLQRRWAPAAPGSRALSMEGPESSDLRRVRVAAYIRLMSRSRRRMRGNNFTRTRSQSQRTERTATGRYRRFRIKSHILPPTGGSPISTVVFR